MHPTRKSTKPSRARHLKTHPTRARRLVAQALALLLFTQAVAPSALAAPGRGAAFDALAGLSGRASAALAALSVAPGAVAAAARKAVAPAAAVRPAAEEFGLVLTPLGTAFNGHTGIDHHQPLRKVVVSANSPTGAPLNFEALDADGTHRPFSNLGGLAGELKIALARDDGQGMSLGGFKPGEMFTGAGVAGVVARVSPDGGAVQNPWVTLQGETGLPDLYVDRTGVFGGDLVVVTTAGGVWRVNSAGAASRLADLGTRLEGVTTVPADATKYGPWAGKILVGAPEQSAVYALDAQGQATSHQLGLAPRDIRVVPAHENFYGLDPAGGKIWGAPDDAFAGIIGDILVAQGTPGVLARVRWNGSQLEVGRLAEVASWGQTAFSPAALAEIGGVKQVYDKIAVVRHAPTLDSGRVEGALWQLLPESLALDGTDVITSDLLVPGTPSVTVGAGKPSFGGVIEGVESAQPAGYSVTVSNNAVLRHVITRTNPINLSAVAAPPAPSGARDLSISKSGEGVGDPATLRHLTLSGSAGAVFVPPGTYGRFSAGGRTALVLGVEGSAQPTVYNLQELSLSGGSELRLAGPVKLNVKGNVSLAGSTVGAADDPRRLLLSVAEGSVGVTGGAVLYGVVRIPQGSVSIGGNGRVRGTVTSDRLNIYGNGVLQITENDVPPPRINRPPTADAGPDQVITLPNEVVSLNGSAADDGLPAGSTLATKWTKVSGPGPVTFADAASAVTTANFTEPGVYTLRLTATDSLLTASDEMTVEVIPRNQPPVVDAGPDQSVELPSTATLKGAVTDDGLPRGSTVTSTWAFVAGPAPVTFADPHDLSTAVTFAQPGVYTLRLTADDTELTASDELVVTVYPENQPPVVNAGADQTLRLPAAAALNGTATDDGLPTNSTLATKWTKVSGPGTVTFANDSAPVTTATFSVEGTYVLRLTGDDTRFNVSDDCVVTVLPRNAPPVVDAGPDREVTFLEALTINGSAADDGLPVGSALEVAWAQVSGPGVAGFASPASPVTAVTFSAPGTYVLRLTGDDTQFTASDEAVVVVKQRPHASRVYTLNSDFDQGNLISVTRSTADQLQLDDTTRSFNFIWVAVSTKGTVVKINTETGAIIGEYFTSPNGQPRDPSRTTVDQNGNVWATNRAGNSVVHIGLVENGQCVDRNGNGVIETSAGFGDIKPWTNAGNANTNGGVSTAADECIIHYTKVNSFGTRHVSVNKDNDVWVSGTSGQRFDLIDGKTGVVKRQEVSVGYGGYGGLIDKNGVIWSAAPMLWWDTSKPLSGANGVNWRGYSHPSYGLCIDSTGNVYNTTYGNGTVRKFSPNGTLIGTYNQGASYAQGCVVDRNDDVWIAHSLNHSSVGHLKSNGTYVGTIPVGSGPTGVAVDGAGKVWATNYYSGTVSRIDPKLGPIGGDGVTRVGAVDFTTPHLGGNPYNYSDMTGSTLTGAPNTGTWSVVFDSQIAGAEWGRIGWTARVCGDGLLTVSVATSENNSTYTQPVVVSDGDDPAVANGRYVRVTVRFERATSGESPVLYDLSIGTVGFPMGAPANDAPGVDAGPDQTIEGTTKTALRASVCDDALPSNRRLALGWSKVSGPGAVTFARPNSPATDVTFGAVGTYTLRFTASDSVHTGGDTLVVTVVPGNQAPAVNAGPDQTVESCQAALRGSVTDDGKPAGNPLLVSWSKLTGPGVVTFADASAAQTSATFSKAGVYVLRLSAGDGALGASDDVSVTVRASGAPFYYDPTNYLSEADSPFRGLDNNYFHLENFEDHLLNTPGVTASAGGAASVVFGPTLHDSVDGDDGLINGSGLAGDNFFSGSGAAGITFTFNASALGSLPTHAGLVWTDGAGQVTFEAFDAQGVSMGLRGPYNFPDAVHSGTTAEDRFLGAFNRGGISRIRVTNSSGGIEIDHLQYGSERSGNNAPAVNAGDNQYLSLPANSLTLGGSATDDGLPLCASLTYAWSKVSGPGAVTFANPAAASTTAAFSTPGIYVLRLTVSDSELSSSDEVTINFSGPNQTPQVNAGPDQSVGLNAAAVLNGIVNDDGLPQNAAVTSTWSMLSGPGLVTFADPSSSSTTAAFSEAGVYVLRLTATDTSLTASDDVVVTVTPPNKAPQPNAGPDLTVTLPGAARLAGSAADDGLPLGSALGYNWSKVSGPGAVTFADAGSAQTAATFGEAGTYVLRLTASDTELTGADDVAVTVNPFAPNRAPQVSAGADLSVSLSSNLVRNPGNDEQLVGGEIGAWTEAVGTSWTRGVPGSDGAPEVVNGDSLFYAGAAAAAELRQDIDVSAFAASIAAGTQSFKWVAHVRSRAEAAPDTARVIFEYRNASNTATIAWLDSGEVASTAAWHVLEDTRPAPAGTGWIRVRLIATRKTGATNDAYFDALSLRPVTGAGVKLAGIIVDDGLPAAGAFSSSWAKVSGPGDVAFADASSPTTSATFAAAGTYVLRLTADDSELTGADDVTVTVAPANAAPAVNAGPDQTVSLPSPAVLAGTVTDDGLPSGAPVTYSWAKVSGPGLVTFADPAALDTAATFSAEGTYVLRLTAGDTDYNPSDTVTVTVKPQPPNQPPAVNAGADQIINPPATSAALVGTVTDDGTPPSGSLTYSWTKVSGPGSVTFGSPTALTTSAAFGEAGAYVLRLTASDSELSASDDVRVTLNGTNKAPTVNAGPDQAVPHPTTVTLSGGAADDGLPADSVLGYNWSKVSGPGTVTFANAGAAQTTAVFSAPGDYVLRLTASDTELTGADDVAVTQTSPPTIGITSPANGATITTRTNIVGSVGEGSSWRVEYSLEEEGVAPAWTTLASGSTPVNNGLLAAFDPTVLLNGTYTVRLVATNASNQTSTINLTALVDGEQKVGNFSLSFTDLSVPMAGLPIEVVREYDSRDKRVGDFGVGWTVGLRNIRLQESGRVGADWQGTVAGGFFPSYCVQPSRPHVVTVTMPTGKVYKFEAALGPQCSTLLPLRETTISYRPMAGTNATLAPVGDATVFVNANFPGPADLLDYDTFTPADFDEYRLTLPSGEVMLISQQSGLRQLSDASGNTLTVSAGGITHSSGKSVAFTRDPQGRITRITDPAGNAMVYAYDPAGDLVSFRDRENNSTTFTYNSSHGLLSIQDPRGKQPLRTEYDGQGRVVRQIDASGKVINLSHDTDNRRELTTDRMGNTTVLEYNARGQVVRVTDPEGNVTTRTYDSRDNLLSETSPLGKTTGFTYDARNNKLSETDPLGNVTRYSYNERDQVLTVANALGHVTTNTYDAGGNLLSTKDPLNQTTTYTYTAKGQIASKTDPLGNVTRFEYDASGNLTKQTDALGGVTTNTYDANGNKLTQTVSRTNASGAAETLVTAYEYDRLGNLLKTTTPDGAVTESAYDSVGKQVATRDQLGRQTRYEYDDLGRMTRLTLADGTTQESTFDAEGRLLTVKDRAGQVTTNTYDSLGRLLKVTHPDGSFTSKAYDALGRVTSETDERGNTTRYEYDPNCGCSGRRTKVIDALGNSTAYTFDAAGNVATMTDARGNVTRHEYDANNRRTRVTHPDNTAEVTAYDAAGRVSSKTDQAGKVTRFEYDREGRLTKITDALGLETRYAYDEAGNLRSQTDANNHTTAFEYDRAGRRVKRTLPLGMSETLAYDAAGNLTGRTNFKGETTTYAYDALNRLTRKTPDARLNQPPVLFTYGPTGKRASMVDAAGTTTYTYDNRDRLTGKVTPHGALTYTYDATGRLTGMASSNAGGVSVSYTYDALKRLSAATDNQQAGTTSYSYDANGNLAAYAQPNGVRSAFTYNGLNRLTALDVSNGAPLAGYAYTLGAAGNRLSVAELGGRQAAYTYDALYRLTGETISGAAAAATNGAVAYTYDPVGNRLGRTSTVAGVTPSAHTYDANDRPAGDTHDADGNLTASAGAAYGYTFEDRLSEVNGGAISFVYDGDGNRVARTVGGVTTKYLVDDRNLTGYAQVVEELVGGSVERAYTYGHDLVSQRRRTGAGWSTSYFGYDGTGSVRFLTDQGGAVTDTYDYDAFGTLIARTGATPNEYLYAGEQLDANVGFYYLRARYMNPDTGRFLTRDTHEGSPFEPLTLHKYLYVGGDPVNKTDPSGMFFLGELALAGGGTMAGRAADAGQKLSILAWVKFMLTALGIGVVAVTAAELIKRAEFPIRLHHYTNFRGLMYVMNPLPGRGGINSPSGTNYFTPDLMWDSDYAEDRLAVCKELDVRITVDIYITRDGLNWPPTTVAGVNCPAGSGGGWGGKRANGGGLEVTTGSAVPFYTRKPMVVPLF